MSCDKFSFWCCFYLPINNYTAATAIVTTHAFDIRRKYPKARNLPSNWWITSFRAEFWSLMWHKLGFHGETSSTALWCKFAFQVGFSTLRTVSSFLGHWQIQLSLLPLLFHNSVSQVGGSFGAVICFIIMYFFLPSLDIYSFGRREDSQKFE